MKKQKFPIENKIYAALILHCDSMEVSGVYRGNGHHLAQKLTELVSVGLLPTQQRKIYDALPSNGYIRVADISKEVKISSKIVAAQLKQIYDHTLLIVRKQDGKNWLWSKAK